MKTQAVSSLMVLSLASARVYQTSGADNSPTFEVTFDPSTSMFKFTAQIMQD